LRKEKKKEKESAAILEKKWKGLVKVMNGFEGSAAILKR